MGATNNSPQRYQKIHSAKKTAFTTNKDGEEGIHMKNKTVCRSVTMSIH